MTREEVGKILSLLASFYGQGKQFNVQEMVCAWELIIGEYDYWVAQRAIVEYVKHDTRDYASFPSAGVIRNAIKEEQAIPSRIFVKIHKGVPYNDLTDKEKTFISEKAYTKASGLRVEALLDKRSDIINYMNQRERKLLQ